MLTEIAFGLNLINQLGQASSIKDTADMNRSINELNAKFVELDAFDTLSKGITEEARYKGVIENTLNEQKVQFATHNVDANFGSAAEVAADTKVQGIVNQAAIKNNAYAGALGLKQQALSLRTQGALNDAAARKRASSIENGAINTVALAGIGAGVWAYNQPPKTNKPDDTITTTYATE